MIARKNSPLRGARRDRSAKMRVMGVFDKLDKLKERAAAALAERAAEKGTAVAKAAARRSAEAAVSVVKGAGKELTDMLFGESAAQPASRKDESRSEAAERKRKEAEIGERLRAADRRVKERDAEEKQVTAERATKRARDEKAVDDELAALKKKVGAKRT